MKHLLQLSILAFAILLATQAKRTGWSRAQDALNATTTAPASLLAPTPPMGWNSYDCYGGDVNEQEVKANADYMAEHLARYGWKYIVVDYYWYYPDGAVQGLPSMDSYGRLIPDPKRFPSSRHGQGFKPLADYVHAKGLKFGIHIMRGIPRAAVEENLPVLDTKAHARDVVNLLNTCSWSKAMYGVDVSKPAGRAYYISLARLYAQWGVDYIKADDMSRAEDPLGEIYHEPEIEQLRRAMTATGRRMVLSLSPGPTPLSDAVNVEHYSQLWRISSDMWDNWRQLADQFGNCRLWEPYAGPNHWPDADMLPLGLLQIRGFPKSFGKPHMTHLTRDEQRTLMTLWFISRSPLMIGADLPSLDTFTLALFSDPEALEADQRSWGNHELFARDQQIAWVANAPGTRAKYLALFNLADSHRERIRVTWAQLELQGECDVRDLWQRKDVGNFSRSFFAGVPAHGAALYKIEPVSNP
ncbi:MAG TPA: glycoside hydrolase family 27 protein [Terriglobia bacterium]|nr:glycoside hydrolase family 27 protein [Terriglobia bacterium]